MYLSRSQSKFEAKTGTNIELQTLERRYSPGWKVASTDDGYHLSASGRLFLNAGYQNSSKPVELTIALSRRRIVVDGATYWPFDELSGGGCATPVWQDISRAIAGRVLGSRVHQCQFGVIPGGITYDKHHNPTLVVCSYPDVVCFYANSALSSFAGQENCNLFRRDSDDMLDLVIIPVSLADELLKAA